MIRAKKTLTKTGLLIAHGSRVERRDSMQKTNAARHKPDGMILMRFARRRAAAGPSTPVTQWRR
jgi:hypothetical protein